MGEIAKKKDREVLYAVIYVAIVAVFFVLPAPAPITTAGMRLLGVFIATVFGWSASSRAWPSLFCFVAFLFTGITDLTGLLAASWGADVFIFAILMFVVMDYLRKSGFSTFLSAWMMTRKVLSGHPYRLIAMLMIIAWVLSTFCGPIPGMFITWGFIYQICELVGYKRLGKEATAMIFGVGVMGALSLSTMPFLNNALVILAAFTKSTGIEINLVNYLLCSIPTDILCIAGYLLMCKFVFRIDVSALQDLDMDFIPKEDLEFTTSVKFAFAFLIILIAMLVLPSLMPKTFFLTQWLNAIGYTGKCFLLMGVWSLLNVNGEKVMRVSKLATDGINWNMAFMMIGIFAFIAFLGVSDTGISAFLSQVLGPVFGGLSPVLFLFLGLVITVVLSNFLANMVVAVIMMTATFPLAAQMGLDFTQLAYLYTIGATVAFCLPAASPPGMLMFANKEWLNAGLIYKYSLPTIVMMTIVVFIWNLVMFMF